MRKLYNHNKGKIHPSPPPPTTTFSSDHLSLLPFSIATLAAALSPEDQELLAYLLSCPLTGKNLSGDPKTSGGGGNHAPRFTCYCFSCYTSYWVRWDSSANRQLIHEIIDAYEAYEDGLVRNKKSGKHKKERKKNNKVPKSLSSAHAPPQDEKFSHAPPQVEESKVENDDGGNDDEASSEKGPVRKFVNFIGERIWGVWGI